MTLALALMLLFGSYADDPPKTAETITVTATRTKTRLADTPTSTVVLSKEAIATTAAATADDALRQVPGFALFRRAGSRTANPTAQGVSLRGIGASGASRAIVLDDGIPMNDPFGGWVYWGRIPRAALQRVEVLRGGASDLYGSGAMSGVVQFIRRSAADRAVSVETTGGSHRTGTTSLFASSGSGSWSGSVAADLFTTGGYVVVSESQRGLVDRAADSRHIAVDATVDHTTVETGRAFLRASRYDESRNNGTPLQTNDTGMTQLAGGIDRPLSSGTLSLRLYGSDQAYAQTFSSIAADRMSERLTVDQRVPSRSGGASAQWSVAAGSRNALVAGAEWRGVSGASDETQFSTTGVTNVRAEGKQRTAAVFVQDIIELTPALSATASLRLDDWSNYAARRNGTALAGRGDSSWSPRLSMIYHAADGVALVASAYQAFRAPTLNELYRGFRVGNVLTLANESLGPERLSAIEAGVRLGNFRATAFQMNVDDAVANVTLSSTPSLITRQRQNVAATRTRGLELESEWRVSRFLRASAGYLLSDAVVTGGQLDGRTLPQVPRHQASLQATLTPSRGTVSLQTRFSSSQFDDDLNQFRLRGYFAADLFASYPLSPHVAAIVAGENIFDRRIEANATPVIAYAAPRSVRVGVRFER